MRRGSGSSIATTNDETPHLERQHNKRLLSSQGKTFANIFIAIVGSGVLGLPYSFKRSGWVTSLITLFSVAAITHYCLMLLIHTRRRLLLSRQSDDEIGSYGDVAFEMFGSIGRIVVDIFVVLSQTGFCVSYLIFIGSTLANLVRGDPTLQAVSVESNKLYIWGCFPFQLGLNSIASLTRLAWLSICADIVDFIAKGVVMGKEILISWSARPQVYAFRGFKEVSYVIGVAVSAFEGVGLVLPLEAEMKERDKFGRMLGLAMGVICVLYNLFGLLGYLAFGNDTQEIITANLGSGIISSVIQVALCVNLFFTFPIMMNPVYEILERRLWGGRHCNWVRWLAVLLLTLTALLIPNFTDFLSLIGNSVCTLLGFVIPALLHIMAFNDQMDWKGKFIDVTIVIVGTVFTVVATCSSLAEMLSAWVSKLVMFNSLPLSFL